MRQGGGQRRSSVAGSIVIGAGETNNDAAYVGKDGQHPAGNNGTVVGRTAIGWSTGDTAYGAFSNAKGSSVLNSNFGLADSFDSLYAKSSGEAFHLITNSNNKLSSNKGGDNVALGFKSSAFGLQSVSLGMKSIASGTNALSVGTRSVARDSYSVAIGSESKGMGEASVAMGTFSNALGNYQLDFAKFNDINNDGYSTITQPEQTYQTSNGSGSLKDNSSKYQLITSTLKTGTDGSTTMESKITAQNTSSNKEDAALGVKAIALGDMSASVGVKTIANGKAALALGTESVARKNYAIAQGYQAKAWEEGAIAIGQQAKANAENAIVLGNGSSNQLQNAVVIGNNITLASGNNSSVVIGHQSTVATNGETRGTSSYSSAEIGGLTYGGFTGTPTSVFSIGPAGGRTLQHVAAGKLSATSMDAVNGSQLYRTNLALGNLAKTLVDNLGDNAAVVKTNGDTLGQLSFSNIGNTGQDTVHNAIKTIAESTIKLEGNNNSSTDKKNRKTNSSFGIKGASGGGITTTASGSDVLISLDDKTKTTLDKVSTIEGELTKTKSDLATTKNDVTTIQNTVNQLSSGKANTALSNLTDKGKNAITGLVDVKSSSTALTVTPETDQSTQKKTFNLALNEDGIKELAGTKTLANDISTAKTQAINASKTYTDGKLGNTPLTAVNGNNNVAPTTITQAINQITSAVNSGWEIQQGSIKKGDIGAGKKVNFTDGNLTTVSVEMSNNSDVATVKFDVQTTQLKNHSSTGKVSATDGNKLVTAGDIATAINTATSSLSSSLAFRGDNNPTVEVDATGDTNTKVDLKKQALKVLGTPGYVTTTAEATATGQTLTIDLNKTLKEKLDNLPTNVKESLQTINNKIGTAPPTTENAKTSPTSSDRLNGKSLTEQIHALRDGAAGNLVYTDSKGNRLVKGSDGEYYLAGTPMDENGLPQDTTAQSVDKSTIVATTVNPDGTTTTPTQMGNVKSSLGLDGKGADGTSGSPSEPKAITAKKAKEALNGNSGLLAMEGANSLNKVATVGDLQALAQAGIDFLGNGGDAIHKTLGSTLKIEGKSNTTYGNDNKANYSADNLITHNDGNTLRIEMLKKPNFEGVQLGSADGKKITLTPDADNGKLTLAKTKEDGSALDNSADNKVVLDGLKAGDTADSAVTKGQLDELASQIGTPVPEDKTGTAGADGLNGKTLAEKVDALRDGTAGNVVYTNQDGERLVKGSDGKYYVAEKVGNKVQGPNGEWYPEGTTFKDGNPIKDGSPATALADADKPKEVAKDSIVSTTVNPDGSTKNPIQMGNVKSGLGLDETATPIAAEKAKEALNGKGDNPGLLAMKGADNLNKVATVGDLQALAQAGLDFNGNNTDAVVHRPLGTKLEIVGDSPATNFASAVGNINVFGDPTNNKLMIQLSKVLTNITSIGGGVKDSVTDKTSTNPENQKAQLTFNDDDLALNNKTLSGVKSAIKPATETQDKTMLDHLKEAAKNKGSSVVNVEDLAGVTTALETKLETELTNKGLSFGGDNGKAVSRKLGEKLNVKGGVTDPTKLTDNNIGVVTDPGKNALIVKLAKKISDISSITTEKTDGQSATFNSEGIKITGYDDKNGQSASYGLGGTTLTNGENKAELKPESLTFSDVTNPNGAKSSLSKDSLSFTKKDGSNGISVNGEKGTISNLADRTLVGNGGNGPLSSDYGTGDNRNNAATEGALKDLADKLGVSTPNTLPIDSATGPSGADGLNGKSVLDKIQALRDGAAGNLVYTDSEGKRLVKGSDGKYYVAEKVGDKVQGPDDKWYPEGTTFKDGKPIAKDGSSATALADTETPKEVAKDSIVSTTVNPDGSTTSPVQMGNVKSGLGLDETATPIAADAAKKAIAGADGNSGLLTQSGASLNKVATIGDLQALAQAGLDFVGNNEENVHRPLGTQLKVVGDGIDAAKAESFESATGNINVKSNATENSLTVQLSKDLKNLTSSEFKDAKGNTTTVNGEGITITPPAKSVVSLTSEGLNNGGNKITNLAKGENDGDAVTIAQLKELTKAVTGSSDINIENKKVNKNNKGLDDGTIFEGEPNGKDVFVEGGKPVLKTYNVSEQKEYLTNSVYTAISNMNEQGIKFFHTNDGKTQQTNQASNTEDSSASGAYATAVGYQSSAEGKNSLAMGSGSVVKGENSIVIGSEGSVHGSDSISVGTGNEVFGDNSGAFGDPSTINAKSSYSVGNNNELGIGKDLTELLEKRKALTRPTRPGKLEKKGTDESPQDYQNRVNAYLEKMAEYNTALADYMEKRDEINKKITELSVQTQGVMAMGNNVTVTQGSHGALVMGSNSYVNVVNSGLDTNIQGIAIGNNTRVYTNASSVALGSGAHALQSLEALQAATVYAHEQAVGKGSEVIGEVSFGKEGEYRRLTNVAAGAADTDAVNVSQLKGVASNINQQLNNLSQNISGVAASSAAMANLPQAYLPGKSMVAVSTGYHKGQSAIALGVSRIADNGKLIIKASASHNTQNDFTGGIGVGYQW